MIRIADDMTTGGQPEQSAREVTGRLRIDGLDEALLNDGPSRATLITLIEVQLEQANIPNLVKRYPGEAKDPVVTLTVPDVPTELQDDTRTLVQEAVSGLLAKPEIETRVVFPE